MEWSYWIEEFDSYKITEVENKLNELGKQGWELVYVSSSLRTYIFKKGKSPKTSYLNEEM